MPIQIDSPYVCSHCGSAWDDASKPYCECGSPRRVLRFLGHFCRGCGGAWPGDRPHCVCGGPYRVPKYAEALPDPEPESEPESEPDPEPEEPCERIVKPRRPAWVSPSSPDYSPAVWQEYESQLFLRRCRLITVLALMTPKPGECLVAVQIPRAPHYQSTSIVKGFSTPIDALEFLWEAGDIFEVEDGRITAVFEHGPTPNVYVAMTPIPPSSPRLTNPTTPATH